MNKKRFLVFLAVLLVAGAGAFAQAADLPPWMQAPPATGPGSANPNWSVTRLTTFDVFAGPYDAMFNLLTIGAGPTFFDLKSPMVAGGFDNLLLGRATAPALNGPVYAGYYSAGAKPFSLYANLAATNAPAETAMTNTTNATGTTTVGSTTYRWVTDQTVDNFNVRPFATTNDVVQGLVGLSSTMATGAALGFTMADNATAAANGTSVETFYYDTTPGAKPTPATDYTQTTTGSAAQNSGFSLILGVPFLLKSGNVSHFANLQVGYAALDNSSSAHYTQSAKQTAGALPFTKTDTVIADVASGLGVTGSYALLTAPIFSKGKDDKFIADADFSVTFAGANYSSTVTGAAMTSPGGGAAPTAAGALTSTVVTGTYGPGIGWKAGAGALHSFYFTPGTGVQLGVVPSVYVDYSMTVPNASLTSENTDVLTDVNANGVQDAGDTIAHTTLNYTNATGLPGAPAAAVNTGLLEVFASLPMAITIKPTGWVFGFTLGTAPRLLFQNSTAYTLAMGQTTSTSTTTVGGATTTPTVTTQTTTDPSTAVTNTWTFTEQHKLALNFDFGNGVTMDVILNTANLFDFNNLSVQVNAALK